MGFFLQSATALRDGKAVNLASDIPTSIVGTNTRTPVVSNGRDVTAGPGHNPLSCVEKMINIFTYKSSIAIKAYVYAWPVFSWLKIRV